MFLFLLKDDSPWINLHIHTLILFHVKQKSCLNFKFGLMRQDFMVPARSSRARAVEEFNPIASPGIIGPAATTAKIQCSFSNKNIWSSICTYIFLCNFHIQPSWIYYKSNHLFPMTFWHFYEIRKDKIWNGLESNCLRPGPTMLGGQMRGEIKTFTEIREKVNLQFITNIQLRLNSLIFLFKCED